jgi:hypothetical protein
MHKISTKAHLEWYFAECAKRGKPPNEDKIEPFLPHNIFLDIKRRLSVEEPEILDTS